MGHRADRRAVLRTGQRTIVWQGGSDARYVRTGHLLFAVGDALFAVAFDAAQHRVLGGPVAVAQGLSRPVNQSASEGTGNYVSSDTGMLVDASGARLDGGGGAGFSTLVDRTR